MIRVFELSLPLDHDQPAIVAAVAKRLKVPASQLRTVEIFREGWDARRRHQVMAVLGVDVEFADPAEEAQVLEAFADDSKVRAKPDTTYHLPRAIVQPPQRPIVIGLGPCGLFAALILAEAGLRPIVIERGKAVRERTVDTFGFWRKGQLDPESNVQFGEGGAGTFSDGKLYSQVKDPRHLGRKVLEEFVLAGAPHEILTAARPHIGTFKLVKMVESMRAKILGLGGDIHFGTRVDDFLIEDGVLRGITLSNGQQLRSDQIVLAIGHSARDTFIKLVERGVFVEPKPFSIGVRIEHPQALIDKVRFGPFASHPKLGAADYRLVHHASNGRSAYSFCMCPGGTVVAAASELGRVVTNGMSQYDRSERNANAGLVVGITPEVDYPDDPLAGIALQRDLEAKAYRAGGETYEAPGQLVGDFLAGRASTAFGAVEPSYKPGVHLGDLRDCLPEFAITAMREALQAFERTMPGFAQSDVVMTGVETRTSSPIRIRRGADYQSINTRGLFPGGEGAGYAGGILSAAIDGIELAEAVIATASSRHD